MKFNLDLDTVTDVLAVTIGVVFLINVVVLVGYCFGKFVLN